MQRIILITCLIIALFISGCANMHYNEGNRHYEQYGYSKAIESYQKALSRKDIFDAKRKMAISYNKTGNYKKAEEWFAKVVTDPDATVEDKIAYAQLLVINGKCGQATEYLVNILQNSPDNQQAKLIVESCNAQSGLMADSALFTIEQIQLNSRGSGFSPVFYNKGFVFAGEGFGKENKISDYTGRPYLNLYYSELDNNNSFSAPLPLKGEINSKYHDGPASFTSDGNTIYFTRNNYLKKKTKKSGEGVVNLKLYKAELVGDEWKNIQPLPFASDEFSTGHATLSSDGNTMYFISDMPGGYGETDIYVSRLINNEWTKPENLGLTINTPGKEMFPYIYQDSLLYFSSDGKAGMGGLDIYYSKMENGKWSDPVNVGFPINSGSDDFGYIADSTGNLGYISSNRNSAGGVDNIFRFIKAIPYFTLSGIVVDKETQLPLPGTLVELINNTTGNKEKALTAEDGTYSFQLEPSSDYKLFASKEEYFTISKNINTNEKDPAEIIYEKIELEKIIIDKPIVIENIYYDFNKWDIRTDATVELDKFAAFLLDNPRIRVELSSHTDSRGSTKYNLDLSQKRAEAAVKYLISKGIPEHNITAMGYGENMLVNRCKDNVQCSEEEHQKNRRTEFKVTGVMAGGTEISSTSASNIDEEENEMEVNTNKIYDKKDIYFTVQIGAVAKGTAAGHNNMEKVKNVRKEEGNDNYIRYFVGKSKSFSEAQAIRNELVGQGFKDAFIIAFHKEEKISVKEAQSLLK
jgi:peptidoglycan-associated lipoprotein